MLIIGSHALNQITPGPRPVDLDVIATYSEALELLKKYNCRAYPINQGRTLVGKGDNGIIVEISIAWPGSLNETLLRYCGDAQYAPLNVLYTLKMSHRYLRNSPHFYKTMRDIKRMRKLGAMVPADLLDWYIDRQKETYDYKHPSLDQGKQTFFSGDGVKYTYDHDSLHQAVAIFEKKPMYTRYQKDGSEVLCDKKKWEKLDHVYKLMAVAEESAVLALERSIVPFPGKKTPMEAFKFALMKVCTSITSGWFREFAWENHDDVLEMVQVNEYDYVGLFEQGLKNGVVKPYVG